MIMYENRSIFDEKKTNRNIQSNFICIPIIYVKLLKTIKN